MTPTPRIPVAHFANEVDAAIASLTIPEPPSWGEASVFDRYVGAASRSDGFVLYETAPGLQFWVGGFALFTLLGTYGFSHQWRGYSIWGILLSLVWLGWAWALLFMFYGGATACKMNAGGFRLRRRLWPLYGRLNRWSDCTWITTAHGWWSEAMVGRKDRGPVRFASTTTGLAAFARVAAAAGLPSFPSACSFVFVVGFVDRGGSKTERMGPYFRGAPGIQHLLFVMAVASGLTSLTGQVVARGVFGVRELAWAAGIVAGLLFPGLQYLALQVRRARDAVKAPKTIALLKDLEVTADGSAGPRVIPPETVSVMGVDWPRRDITLFLTDRKKVPLGPIPDTMTMNLRSWAVRGGATMALRPDYWFWRPFARKPYASKLPALNPEAMLGSAR